MRFWVLLAVLLAAAGCAKYNTYFNAKRAFDRAEDVRREAIKQHRDPGVPSGAQRADYETAIVKSQKVLDEYPGHSLTDDALFLQAKAHHRLEAYRQSIRKLNLLFQNFPASDYEEEALYLQALNFLLIGAVDTSQEYLDRLARAFPDSRYQAETRRVSGDNAFALQRWEEAADSYKLYLDLEQDSDTRDRIGLKLAECYWELQEYYPAAEVLQDVSQNTTSAELGFRARLLRGRVHVRMRDFEIVDLLLSQLRDEAAIYSAEGDVALLEAEALIAQGRIEEATPLLENMPAEWETPEVKARAAEILGEVMLARGDWVKAREKFQAALVKRDVLDDEDRVRRLSETLKDYLAAEQALPDASGAKVARLKLLQANSLLFGFDRPHMAATLYGEAAADSAADGTDAARSLYGAYLTYRNFLDEPDSAGIYRERLLDGHPDSPQAFEARADSATDLFGYLLEMRSEAQAENFAALTPEERLALSELGDVETVGGSRGRRALEGVRRRKVYLSRRPPLVYPPPQDAIEAIARRHAERVTAAAEDAARQAAFDSVQAAQPPAAAVGAAPDSLAGPVADPRRALGDTGRQNLQGRAGAQVDTTVGPGGEPDADQKKDKDEKKKKREQEEGWDFLR